MKKKPPLLINVKIKNYKQISKKDSIIKKLRQLTLEDNSGLNNELNNFDIINQTRNVDAKILLAYYNREIIGWAILSNEKTSFRFHCYPKYIPGGIRYNPKKGSLFELYVNPKFRHQQIGYQLLKAAIKCKEKNKICVYPWNNSSYKFFNNASKQFDCIKIN